MKDRPLPSHDESQSETHPSLRELIAKQSLRVSSVRARTRGRLGEVMASTLFPASIRDKVLIDKVAFETPFGVRRVDNFHPETKHAVESKYLRLTASRRIRLQIEKDVFLLRTGVFSEVTWVLYYGGSQKALELLRGGGIGIVDCWDALAAEGKKQEDDPSRILKIRI